MQWIKSIILDLAILAVIVVFVFVGTEWSRWVVIIYTPLMLLLKVVALAGARSVPKMKKTVSNVPSLVYHVLYGINVALLVIGKEYLLVVGWIAIWILSVVIDSRIDKR